MWNPDADAILTALSCLKFLCTEVNTVSNQSMDNIAQLNLVTSIFAVYEELANLANGISTGGKMELLYSFKRIQRTYRASVMKKRLNQRS